MSTPSPASRSLGHVLVVGGCGFLGHHIVSLLYERFPASRISVLDLRTTRNRHPSSGSKGSQISYHDGDITDSSAMGEIFTKLRPDVVIHTASPVFNDNNREMMYKVNVTGTEVLLEASKNADVKGFVYTSSASVIMDKSMEVINADERWPLVMGDDQPEYYTTTKALAELAVLRSNRTSTHPRFLTAAIRPAGIIGEGDVQVLPKMLTASRKGQSKFQIGENNNLFDFTYVQNIAWAHLLAASALLQTHKLATAPLDHEKVDGEAFFITNGSPVYFWDFARSVWRERGDARDPKKNIVLSQGVAFFIGFMLEWIFWLLGRVPNLTTQQARYSCMTRYYNIDKAKTRLGYAPIVGLDEGIRRGVRDVLEREGFGNEKKTQ